MNDTICIVHNLIVLQQLVPFGKPLFASQLVEVNTVNRTKKLAPAIGDTTQDLVVVLAVYSDALIRFFPILRTDRQTTCCIFVIFVNMIRTNRHVSRTNILILSLNVIGLFRLALYLPQSLHMQFVSSHASLALRRLIQVLHTEILRVMI